MRLRSFSAFFLATITTATFAGLNLVACSDDPGVSSGAAGGGGPTTSSTTGGGGTSTGGGGAGGDGAGGGASGTKYDCSPPEGAAPNLVLTPLVSGLQRPVLIKAAPGDDTRLFIVSQNGKIEIFSNGVLLPAPFLDITSKVKQPSGGDERGLLGLAFHPDYAQNGRFFVFYTNKDGVGDQVVEEYARSANDPSLASPDKVQTLFIEPDSEANHNGGALEFSPKDGFLYIGMGDEGGAGDEHGAFGNGLNLATRWGKILRVDVSTTPYSIPAGNMTSVPPGNPTVGQVVPEIWDYGLRNPWRISFDACTGDLYIGDVGQGSWEEIDVEAPGQGNKNYGWRTTEGNHCYNPAVGCDMTGITPAVAEYDHSLGCSVSGGYVYRGSAIPALRGAYFYGDFCSGRVWSLRWENGVASTPFEHGALKMAKNTLVSFGQDNLGNVYVLGLDGKIFRIDAL